MDVVVVVGGVVVGWPELDTSELASAFLRAWNSAARFLSFNFLFRLFCLRLAGGDWGWGGFEFGAEEDGW